MKATKFELQTIQEFALGGVPTLTASPARFWVGTSTMEKQGVNQWRATFKVKRYDIGNRTYECEAQAFGTFGYCLRVALLQDMKYRIEKL